MKARKITEIVDTPWAIIGYNWQNGSKAARN